MHVDFQFIEKNIPNIEHMNHPFPVDAVFNIDSRTVGQGDIFVALCGEKTDGHNYIQQALDKGAQGFILSADKKDFVLQHYGPLLKNKSVLFVQNTKQALIDIAHAWRSKFTFPVVGVTGTVGKTTTKELLRNIVKASHLQGVVSYGNQNTLIGISLNILKMRATDSIAVFELGISQIGNMKQLVDLVRPTHAVITHVGHGHIQGLGSRVAYEKRQIFANFNRDCIGVINGDQAELCDVSYAHPVIRFGKKSKNQIQARKIAFHNNTTQFVIKIYKKSYPVTLRSCNEALIMNTLAAVAVGKALGLDDAVLIQAIEQPVVVNGRFEMIHQPSKAILINDAYNANPESMKAAILAFDRLIIAQHKIVVLGDMKELGDNSAFLHRKIARYLGKINNLAMIVLIGQQVEHMKKSVPYGVKVAYFPSIEQAQQMVKELANDSQNCILFKASLSMRFADLLRYIQS